MGSRTIVVTDYHKKRTMGNVQKEGTMKFPTRWFCCTSKRSCDRISTYRFKKRKKNVGQMPRNVTLHVLLANASSHSRRSTRWNKRCAPTWSGSSTSIPHLCVIFDIAFSKLSPCPTCLKPPKTTMERWRHKPLLPTFLPTTSMLSFEETRHKTDGDELEPASRSP